MFHRRGGTVRQQRAGNSRRAPDESHATFYKEHEHSQLLLPTSVAEL